MTERICCSVDEARKMIGVGTTTLYRMIDQGEVETIKIGNRRFVKLESLRKFGWTGGLPSGMLTAVDVQRIVREELAAHERRRRADLERAFVTALSAFTKELRP